MAGFRVHLAGGGAVGFASFVYAALSGVASVWQLICLAALGALGGVFPDLDSDTGRPIKLLFALVSTLVVVITVSSLISQGSSLTTILGSAACAYISCLVFFYVSKRLTVHRGIMHSIPFALLLGVLAAVVTSGWGQSASLFAGLAMFAGVSIHLLLDELNSLGVCYGFVPYVKKSFGSALKFRGQSFFASVFVYGLVIVLACFYMVVI